MLTDREFVFWLRGYLCDAREPSLNKRQLGTVKRYLGLVAYEKPLDRAIQGQEADYEEEIDLYTTFGGD